MSIEQIKLISLIIGLTLISGLADSQGFVHAASVWQNGQLIWKELGKSALGFAVGIAAYWIVVKYLQELGIVLPEIQTVIWFGVTIIGVALVSGQFFNWSLFDQTLAVTILVGLAWLLFRTGG